MKEQGFPLAPLSPKNKPQSEDFNVLLPHLDGVVPLLVRD